MLSPNPRDYDVRFRADVLLRDGSHQIWSPPPTQPWGFFERHRAERFRKWANDHVRLDDHRVVWLDSARFIGRQVGTPGNPAVAVTMMRQWAPVRPLGAGAFREPASEDQFKSYTFFTQAFGAEGVHR